MDKEQTKYVEVKLSDVIKYFAKDYTGYIHHEAFIDTAKNTVIFKITTEAGEL